MEAGVPYFMVIPLIVVIGLSFMKFHTMICLAAGMVSSLICGLFIFSTSCFLVKKRRSHS